MQATWIFIYPHFHAFQICTCYIGHMEDNVTQADPESRVLKKFHVKKQAITSYFDTLFTKYKVQMLTQYSS